MTQYSVGLTGTTSAGGTGLTAGVGAYQSLSTVIKEHAVGRFMDTINSEAPILGNGTLRQETRKGEEYTFTVFAGPQSSTTWIRDLQPLPRGTSIVPVKGRALPSSITDRILIGRGAADAEVLDGDGVISMLDVNMQNTADQCARHLARGLFGGSVSPQAQATWGNLSTVNTVANTAGPNATVTVPFLDVTMFREGMGVDFIDTSTGLAYVLRVTGITFAPLGANSENTSGNVSFINDVLDTSTTSGAITSLGVSPTVDTADFFKLRGTTVGFGGSSATVTGNPIVSFDDISGSGALTTIYGLDPASVPGWTGNSATLGGIYNQEYFIAKMAKMRNRGAKKLNRCVMNPNMVAAHAASTGQASAAFGNTAGISPTYIVNLDKNRDKYGDINNTSYSIGGVKITEDPNCPATTAIFWNNDAVYLAWWRKIAPFEEGGDPLLIGRSTYSYEVQVGGAAQLIAEDRKSVLIVGGVTGI